MLLAVYYFAKGCKEPGVHDDQDEYHCGISAYGKRPAICYESFDSATGLLTAEPTGAQS